MYRSWAPWDTSPVRDEEAKVFVYVGVPLITLGVIFGSIHYGIKNNRRNDPVTVTKKEMVTLKDGAQKQVWHAKDARGLFTDNTTFVVAENGQDSAYAEKKNFALGKFLLNNQLELADHHSKGSGWSDPHIVNYEIK